MPLYEYQCDACGERFEAIRKFSDPPLEVCEKCGKGPIQRLVSSPAFQFKGSGWYITDYAKKSGSPSTDSGTKDSSTAPKADTASTDKIESKPADTAKSETPAKPATPSTSKD
jgi:putative FmdB family regulatory protein